MAQPLPSIDTSVTLAATVASAHTKDAQPTASGAPTAQQQADPQMTDSKDLDRPPVSPITPTADATEPASQPPPQQLPPPITAPPSVAATLKPIQTQTTASNATAHQQQRQQPPLQPPAQTQAPPPPPEPKYMPRPDPVPINESDNPDIMALRSAMSILQFQKEKALRDMKTLQQLKQAAKEDPDTFTSELVSGRLRAEPEAKNPLSASYISSDDDDDDDDDENKNDHDNTKNDETKTDEMKIDSYPTVRGTAQGTEPIANAAEPKDESKDESKPNPRKKLPKIPAAQNVFRCPPVNWSQYHIVGESLDKMHADQQARPSPGEVQRDGQARAAEHVMAAPYSPFYELDEQPGMVTRRSAKRPF